jgi:hypothetical protein
MVALLMGEVKEVVNQKFEERIPQAIQALQQVRTLQ